MDNPIWVMVHFLHTLKDKNENVLLEGFYDDVRKPTEEDERILQKLAEAFDEAAVLKLEDVKRFKLGLSGIDLLRRFAFYPELNIDGIEGGYNGAGSKTLLPHEVTVKIDLRTVPNMEPMKVIKSLEKHIDELGLSGIITMTYQNAYNWSRMAPDHPVILAMIDAFRELGFTYNIWHTRAGSAPLSLFQNMLNLPFVFGGPGHSHRSHSPNEYAVVKGMRHMEKCIVLFLQNVAR
jgi:acetylornithine deacetylase/succinyl-diaminopimelate desuccinylase-like protein